MKNTAAFFLSFIIAVLVLSQTASAQWGSWSGGGSMFNGGTISGLFGISSTASASAMFTITGQSGQTGGYINVIPEDDSVSRFTLQPNGTSGSLLFSYRPLTTGATGILASFGSSGTQSMALTNNSMINFDNGVSAGGTVSSGALTQDGYFNVTAAGAVYGKHITSGTALSWQLPDARATASITLPTCSTSADAGKIWYVDDTDDAASGMTCVCRANSAGTYAAVDISDNTTACIDP